MEYISFYEKMKECRLVSDEWRNIIKLLANEIKHIDNLDDVLKLFILYFSLVDDGNTYMPLCSKKIKEIFEEKINHQKITDSEETESESDKSRIDELDDIIHEINRLADKVNIIDNTISVIGTDRLFIIDSNRLFARKYFNAVESIKTSSERLMKHGVNTYSTSFDLDRIPQLKDKNGNPCGLKDGQKEIVKKGICNNLLVTGGPGTGKTTSVFFLLLGLLCADDNYNIYLTAPSGKAASQMSESIAREKDSVEESFKNIHKNVIEKITGVQGQTIHRLLQTDRDTNGFVYNKDNQFASNSIFVIDEASMIDVCLFASLLEAIPDNARVFILGDKNQLPSVECGAVYGELLDICKYNVVELTETNRFSKDSEIYKLSERVNQGIDLEINNDIFSDIEKFDKTDFNTEGVYYFSDYGNNKEIITKISETWYKTFFKDIKKYCTDINTDYALLNEIYSISEKAKILCALRETMRGSKYINNAILEKNYKGKRISGFYPGELLMITSNLRSLDLYNGECGITVKFENDDNLYFMIEKSESEKLKPAEVKLENQIFRLGKYFFYPITMIGRDDIDSAFAITVHKAQGSGYDNVLVILPKTKGHPLLNRQLLYTAITRTKKKVYIISNVDNLNCATKNVLKRQTGIL